VSGTLECGSENLLDIGVTGLAGTFTLAAEASFMPHNERCIREMEVCDNDVVGVSAPLRLPARALTLQRVQLPDGIEGYAAGDLLIYQEEGQPRRKSLAELGTSTFQINGSDLPSTATLPENRRDRWSMKVRNVELLPWLETQGVGKGLRQVNITAEITIGAGENGDVDAERTRAEASRLLACDRVQLVSHRRSLRPANRREVTEACRALAEHDRTTVTWTYTVGRHEIPVGMSYSLGRDPQTHFFASASLTRFDPR
jgi:hypothetical protein